MKLLMSIINGGKMIWIKRSELLKEINKIKEDIQTINNNVRWKETENDLVACEKCKCLIKKIDAVRGKSEIKSRIKYVPICGISRMIYTTPKEMEYIHKAYYCHRCKPKEKK